MADDASLVAIHNRRERDRDQLAQPLLEPGTRINSLTFTEPQLRAERRRVIRVAVCLAALVVIVVATIAYVSTCTQEAGRLRCPSLVAAFFGLPHGGGDQDQPDAIDLTSVHRDELPDQDRIFMSDDSYQLLHPSNNAPARYAGEENKRSLYVSTDKPVYRPGEPVYWRAVMLDMYNHSVVTARPPDGKFIVKGPKGDTILNEHMGYTFWRPDTSDAAQRKDDDLVRVAGGVWHVPAGTAGGDYTLLVTVPTTAGAERKIQIRSFRTPRLTIAIDFASNGYMPGSDVTAVVSVKRAEGGVPAGAMVTCSAVIDGNALSDGAMRPVYLDHDGKAKASFRLPSADQMERGQGTLSVTVEDGGVIESSAKPIPIIFHAADITFYPEAGCDLVAGIESTVYFEARLPSDEPLDLVGEIIERSGNAAARMVTTAATIHEGRGKFAFTPNLGAKYALQIIEPAGFTGKRFDLPPVVPAGTTVHTFRDVYHHSDVISAKISFATAPSAAQSPVAVPNPFTCSPMQDLSQTDPLVYSKYGYRVQPVSEQLLVRLFKKDRLVQQQVLQIPDQLSSGGQRTGFKNVDLILDQAAAGAIGVLRLTVLRLVKVTTANRKIIATIKSSMQQRAQSSADTDHPAWVKPVPVGPLKAPEVLDFWVPVAERLVFRTPKASLQLDVTIGKPGSTDSDVSFGPGDEVELHVLATHLGTPVPALIGVSVTDDSSLQLVEPRLQSPRLPVMVLLEDEVRQLVDSDIYADLISAAGRTLGGPKSYPNGKQVSHTEAVNLLLGTQGWRRFAFHYAAEFARAHPSSGKRVLGVVEQIVIEVMAMGMAMAGAERAGGPPRAMRMKKAMFGNAAPAEAFQDMLPQAAMADGALMDGGAPAPMLQEPPVGPGAPIPQAMAMRQQQEDVIVERLDQSAQLVLVPNRIYAHHRLARPEANPGSHQGAIQRTDFTETVLWVSGQRCDEAGKASYRFRLPDSMTAFRVLVDGVGMAPAATGAGGTAAPQAHVLLGSNDHTKFSSLRPFYTEPKLPLRLAVGDTVMVPVSVINASPRHLVARTTVQVLQRKLTANETCKASATTGAAMGVVSDDMCISAALGTPRAEQNLNQINARAGSRTRQFVELEALEPHSRVVINLQTEAADQDSPQQVLFSDTVSRPVPVFMKGFPFVINKGGKVGVITGPESSSVDSKHSITIPTDVISNTINASICVYPSPAANLLKALEALIREPSGCFEQTSSTSYPMVMAQRYFKAQSNVPAELITRADQHLASAYKKLISFETSTQGFEWFGQTPGHEALTAYGLMQFLDMKKVYPVDQAMLDRTIKWLIDRISRDTAFSSSEPIFQRNERALDTFGAAPLEVTDAYILWSLTYAGVTVPRVDEMLRVLIARVKEGGRSWAEDGYYIGLVAGILRNLNKRTQANDLLQELTKHQLPDGSLRNAATSITRSSGASLFVETTSIAILGWLDAEEFTGNVERAVKWLSTECADGKFGSTQGTVLALKALLAYEEYRAHNSAAMIGALSLKINGKQVGSSIDMPAAPLTALCFDQAATSSALTAAIAGTGATATVKVVISAAPSAAASRLDARQTVTLPVSVSVSYRMVDPPSNEDAVFDLSTRLSANELKEGQAAQIMVKLKSRKDEPVGMTVAIIGLPAGLEPSPVQLKQLVADRTIDAFELMADSGDVVLYWRGLDRLASKSLAVDVIAAVPGSFTGGASRAYLYYTDELKTWVAGIKCEVKPAM